MVGDAKGEKLVFTLVSLSDFFPYGRRGSEASGILKNGSKVINQGESHNLLETDINLIFMIRRTFNCLLQLKGCWRRVELMAPRFNPVS
jgi:hypothetical protein